VSAGVDEREVKLDVDLAFTLPDLRALVGRTVRLPDQTLRATYFDTPEMDLWRRGITLRHRSGEGSESGVWTMKVPRPSHGPVLDRSELSWSMPKDHIPDEANLILKGIVRHARLSEVAVMETARRRLKLVGGEERDLGELDDDTVTVHGGPNDGRRFRQIEFELDAAPEPVVKAIIGRLSQAGARLGASGPKLSRALGTDWSDPDGADERKIWPRSSIGDLVRDTISGGLDRVLDHEYRLRIDPESPSPVHIHKMRVATRRLRSDLKTFSALLDPIWTGNVRSDLQWLASALGQVRDADVLGDYLEKRRSEGTVDRSGLALLTATVDRERRSALVELREVLASQRYLLLLDKLHAASREPPFRSGDDASRRAATVLPGLLTRPWKRLRRGVHHSGRHPSDTQLHEIRKRAKQLRYAAEVATPVLGKAAKRTAKDAEQLQVVLGRHQDAVVADRWFRLQAHRDPAGVAFSAGQLSCAQDRRRRQARGQWQASWKRMKRRRPR
jgi:CHAD domain-containing protein